MEVNEKRLHELVSSFVNSYTDECWLNSWGFSSDDIDRYCPHCPWMNEDLSHISTCYDAVIKYLTERKGE